LEFTANQFSLQANCYYVKLIPGERKTQQKAKPLLYVIA
jgi:hypothetical protein